MADTRGQPHRTGDHMPARGTTPAGNRAVPGPATRSPGSHRPGSFVEVLETMPALWARLLSQHVPDATGRRCRACTTPGTGSPGSYWPCRIREAAEAARHRFLAHPSDHTNRAP